MDEVRREELEGISLEVRKDIVRMVGLARANGLASSLALTNLLVYLYWERMNVRPEDRCRPDRDRFVMGHGCAVPALYACLARRGFFGRDELWSYRRLGATLQGYPALKTPGIDAPGGLSGGGLGIAAGLCIGLKMDGLGSRVYCVLNRNELCEGVLWESVRSAAAGGLGHLAAVIEIGEGWASPGGCADEASPARFGAFGWFVCEADGEDFASLDGAFSGLDFGDGRPKAVFVRTRVDQGLSSAGVLEDSVRPMSDDEMEHALSLLERQSGSGRVFEDGA